VPNPNPGKHPGKKTGRNFAKKKKKCGRSNSRPAFESVKTPDGEKRN
jgi:hypothetical protein